MPSTPVTDAELAVVAAVAGREGWADLSSPPEDHGPRTLSEERAVARFQGAIPRARSARASRVRARLLVVALTVVVLGVCWYVSPARTAIGLVGAGVFSLIALRRARRREAAGAAARPRRRFSGALGPR